MKFYVIPDLIEAYPRTGKRWLKRHEKRVKKFGTKMLHGAQGAAHKRAAEFMRRSGGSATGTASEQRLFAKAGALRAAAKRKKS